MLARPVISEVVQDTKVLLQQSRERLVITFVAKCPFLIIRADEVIKQPRCK